MTVTEIDRQSTIVPPSDVEGLDEQHRWDCKDCAGKEDQFD